MDDLVVAAPADLAATLDAEGLDVVAWDGTGSPPREDIAFWVPGYVVGRGAEDIGEVVRALPSLRYVQLLSAGVEPWPGLLPDDVTLCAGKGVHGGSTAELAVALVLSLVRDLPAYADQQARREWRRHPPDTIAGKHALVLGAGDIGSRVAATLETLDARVSLAARTRHLSLEDAHALLPDVDLLVVALPLTDDTAGLVDASWLSRLPDGAIVVNVARGPIVDLAALTDEVGAGRLRAALDVTDPEPLPADHPLWSLPGALVTPHVGGGASGWQTRASDLVNDQLRRVLAGDRLRHVVDAGY